jgi:lipoate-protein ligase B
MRRPATLLTFGRLDYEEAWALQHRLVQQRHSDERSDTLVLLEHGPVYTIGRSGRVEHWRSERHNNESSIHESGIPVHHVERGGSVTYHGPGQIVGYPILRLSTYCAGPKSYMRMLEEVLIRTVADWNIPATRTQGLTGVWVMRDGPAKVAALGVRIARGITMHGFALNVAMDLTPFSRILPCGLAGCHITSMEQMLDSAPNLGTVRQRIALHFSQVFGIDWRGDPTAVGLDAGMTITAPAVQ